MKKFKVKSKAFSTRKISYLSIYFALFLILSFVPQTGYITITTISFTTMPILIVVASLHLKFLGAMVASLAFGLSSLVRSYTATINPFFIYPDISVLTRLILGLLIYWISKKISSNFKLWHFVFLAIVCVALNTTLVTLFLYLHHEIWPIEFLNGEAWWFWFSLIYLNFVIEIGIAIFLALLLYKFVVWICNSKTNFDY